MSKLIYILSFIFILSLFSACGDSDEKEDQYDGTSFVFTTDDPVLWVNVVIGHLDNNKYKKVADIGGVTKDVYSKEISVNTNINQIYFFADSQQNESEAWMKDTVFVIKRGQKNIFKIFHSTKEHIVSKNTNLYPH